MRRHSAIDLSSLPAPRVVEPLDFATIKGQMVADLVARDPAFSALLESDPAVKVLEVAAYRELLLRQRINDAARSTMVAHAVGGDLDNLAALLGVVRLVLDPGDPSARPPVPPTMEADSRLRLRVTMALDGYPTAGSVESYEFHAMSSSARVRDVHVGSPSPGHVVLTVLAADNDGVPDHLLLDTAAAAVGDDKVRPLTDRVSVRAPSVVAYRVRATLALYRGPDADLVRQAAAAAVAAHVRSLARLGHDVAVSGLHGALHRAGVRQVTLTEPSADILVADDAVAICRGVEVAVADVRDD